MHFRDYVVVALSVLSLVAAIVLSVRIGTFPLIPRAWLVFPVILVVFFSVVAGRISRTIKGYVHGHLVSVANDHNVFVGIGPAFLLTKPL